MSPPTYELAHYLRGGLVGEEEWRWKGESWPGAAQKSTNPVFRKQIRGGAKGRRKQDEREESDRDCKDAGQRAGKEDDFIHSCALHDADQLVFWHMSRKLSQARTRWRAAADALT